MTGTDSLNRGATPGVTVTTSVTLNCFELGSHIGRQSGLDIVNVLTGMAESIRRSDEVDGDALLADVAAALISWAGDPEIDSVTEDLRWMLTGILANLDNRAGGTQ